jgi:outer membrane protein assembly factor BamB
MSILKEGNEQKHYVILDGFKSPAIADGKVYVGSSGRRSANLHCLDAFTGETLWQFKRFNFLMPGFLMQPAIADGKIYAGIINELFPHGFLYCFGEAK